MRNVARWLAFPMLMAIGIALTRAGMARGLNASVASTIAVVVLWLALWRLEQVLPFREAWNEPDGQKLHDVGHSIFGTALGGSLGNLAAEVTFGAASLHLAAGGSKLWPTQWSLAVQILFVVLLADFGRYVQHRLLHRVPFLWRIHELHHSTPALTVWKASRSHILERLMQMLFMFGPLLLLGAPASVLVYYVVPNTLLGLFAHSNVDLRLGPLELLVMGPASHRIHHSADPTQGNANFGSGIVLWDMVFRTHVDPHKTPLAERMGIEADPTPRGFVAQIIEPFRARR